MRRPALSLTELLASLVLIGALAALAMPRAMGHLGAGKKAACHANAGEIELQAQLWKRVNGALPATNLSDIGASGVYFPEGLPVCPVDGSAYTLDGTTGRIVGHAH